MSTQSMVERQKQAAQMARSDGSSEPAPPADGWYWAELRKFCTPIRIVEIRRGKGYECGCELPRKASEYLLLEGPLKPNGEEVRR
jgi:hypothetical protein